MKFDIGVILASGHEILSGLALTVLIWIAGSALGLGLGFIVATLRRYGGPLVNLGLAIPVEILRGTPFLVQIFLLYFGGPFIGLSLDPIPAGLLGLTVYGAAYYSEIFRAGYQSVPEGHVEAADCLGFGRIQTIRHVLLPEMALIVLPPAVNMTVILLKETALLSLITVPELTLTVQAIGSQKYAFLESLFVLALVYWALVEIAGQLGRLAEGYFSRYRTART